MRDRERPRIVLGIVLLICIAGIWFFTRTGSGPVKLGPPAIAEGVYYSGFYWNDLQVVQEDVMQKRATGLQDLDWQRFILSYNGGKPYENVLIVGCGNGWVERDLLAKGVIKQALGLDFLQVMVDEAIQEAKQASIFSSFWSKNSLSYQQHDMNSEHPIPDGQYDLVINHAAAHHFGHIDFAMKEIRRVMSPSGKFVSMDYVGPHRNQYNSQTWTAIVAANAALPEAMRQNLGYPHLPTMLHNDPSEACHAELIMETMRRYFFIDRFSPVGGAIAYPILTHNKNLQKHCNEVSAAGRCMLSAKWSRELKKLLEADAEWLGVDPQGRTLFAFIIASPLDSGLPDERFSRLISEHENAREISGIKTKYYGSTTSHDGFYITAKASPPMLSQK